jgi:dienelactone hydrolase
MCWIEWDLPWMPWEESRLMLGTVGEDGGIERMEHIAGGDGASIFQPQWGEDGRLYFVSDETGWGNLYVWQGGTISRVLAMQAEFGRPLWGLATQAYAVAGTGRLIASYFEQGLCRLAEIDVAPGNLHQLEQPFSSIDDICRTDDGVAVLRRAMSSEIEPGTVSRGQFIRVPLASGGETYAVYYPPTNAAFCGEPDTAPPLVAAAHGGPTGRADRGLKLKIQYWTSRGFAFVDVDYRGSAGYGTAYRDALNGHWGVRDVEDVIAATDWLVDQGLADGGRRVISGGSAGGYTVLSALTFHDTFAAGASYYGVGDLQKLLDLTHKFESGYIYNLTGTSPGDTEQVFQARSPLHHAAQISSPVIFFQGTEDKVVPPGQSREMVDALKRQGIPVAYLEFEGEGHGFRQAETIVAALSGEYAFFATVLGLEPREELPDLVIHNREKL